MENPLDLLILLFEEEKMKLKSRINQYIKESDYLNAHYHSEALIHLTHKLQTLHNIADKNYDEKERKKKSIDYLETVIHTPDNQRMKNYHQEELNKENRELERLNEFKDPVIPNEMTVILNDILLKLVANKIKGLRLILNRKENLSLRISYGKSIESRFPNVKSLPRSRTLSIRTKSFMDLGFELSGNENKLMLILEGVKTIF